MLLHLNNSQEADADLAKRGEGQCNNNKNHSVARCLTTKSHPKGEQPILHAYSSNTNEDVGGYYPKKMEKNMKNLESAGSAAMAETTSAAWSPHFDDVDLGQLLVGAALPLFDTRAQCSTPLKHSSKPPKPFGQQGGDHKAIQNRLFRSAKGGGRN